MSAQCTDHCHTPTASADPRYRRILWIALLVNAAMFVVELGAGLSSGSASLLADAIDFLGRRGQLRRIAPECWPWRCSGAPGQRCSKAPACWPWGCL